MVRASQGTLSAATFGEDPEAANMLNLSNRDIHDLGSVVQLTQLTELNLAFNRLENLHSLSALTSLRALNVSHNSLNSLKGLGELTQLAHLNVSCNRIRHLGALANCPSLQTLWLQHNQVHDTVQLEEIASSLPNLTHLWLSGNPICNLGSRAAYRSSVIRAVGSLCALDSKPVTQEDHRTAALLTPATTDRQQAGDGPWLELHENGHVQQYGSKVGFASPTPTKFGRRSRHDSPSLPKPPKNDVPKDFRISQVADLLPDLGLAAVQSLSTTESNHHVRRSKVKAVSVPKQGRRRTMPATCEESLAQTIEGWDQDSDDRTLAAAKEMLQTLAAQQQQLLGNELSNGSLAAEEGNGDSALATSKQMLISDRFCENQEQPHVQETKKSRSPNNISSNTYEATYPKNRSSAVTVHSDGSVHIMWPNGDLAVMCQAEIYAQRPSFRLQVYYRISGALAVAFDPDGSGFVQYPDGRMMLIYRTDGEGTVYAPEGTITRQWHDSASNSLAPLAPDDPVQIQLDQFLGVQVAISSNGPAGQGRPQMEIFFACEGIQQRVIHGYNPAQKSWAACEGANSITPPFLNKLGHDPKHRRKGPRPPRDDRPLDARMEDVASVAAAMKDLDKHLNSWLSNTNPA